MAIICWGNLAKDASSVQRIEQAIEDYVDTHDRNPNAHMGEDYALGVHRLQAVMDHLPGSVYPEHLNADISRTIKVEQIVSEILSDGEWVNINGLSYQFNSSTNGTMLIIVKVTPHRIEEAGDLYLRIRMSKESVISYEPSINGEIQFEASYLLPGERCSSVFIGNINLTQGAYSIRVQAKIDGASDNFELQANNDWNKGSMVIISVGSEIVTVE
jgi:hypothetical protein